MLKRGIEVIVGAALVLALLTVVPAVAQAQEGLGGAAPARVVVKPGDTLWSISEERLGPQATSQQIASEVERIYALNRERIGPNPNLIVSGQKFSLPTAAGSSVGESATNMTAPAAQQIARPARGTAAKGTAKGGRTVMGQISEQQASLPKVPASAAVPTIGSLATDAPPTSSPVLSFQESMRSAVMSAVAKSVDTLAEARTTGDGRRLLGWGVVTLTVLVCALMAWKLPMRRYTRDEKEVWGIYAGYPAGAYQTYARKTLDPYANTLASVPTTSVPTVSEPEPATNGSKAQATALEKGASPVGLGGIAQNRRRQLTRRTSSKRLLPHNKRMRSRRRRSAAEAYSAEARRLLRGAGHRPRAAREPRRSSGRIKTARRVASGGGR
jgi:LysM repeat protein